MPSGKLTSTALVAEVRLMLKHGFRHKFIAQQKQISVKLVERISSGAITGKPRVTIENAPKLTRVRCKECGGVNYDKKCMVCRDRKALAASFLVYQNS